MMIISKKLSDNNIQSIPLGCTPIDHPGPRWSGYKFNLKELGLEIETIHENHKGPFPGAHARYVLRSKVTRLEGGAQ